MSPVLLLLTATWHHFPTLSTLNPHPRNNPQASDILHTLELHLDGKLLVLGDSDTLGSEDAGEGRHQDRLL